MRQKHVVVVFQNRLFGEAIARALGASAEVDVTVLSVDDASPERLAEIAPDAIVIEDPPVGGGIRRCLMDAAPALTIVVGPEENTAEVYQRHEMIDATAAEIVARITREADGARHRATARSPSHRAKEDER